MRKDMKTELRVMPIDVAFKALEAQGWAPKWCDTPVPYFDNPVACGNPTAIGDAVKGYKMLPQEMVEGLDAFMVRARGDSMKDAGILDGDLVLIDKAARIYDGDIVAAMVDGGQTIKCYCADPDGQPWLVPKNEAYLAIPLDEGSNLYIYGLVVDVFRHAPRVNSHECMKIIEKTKRELHKPKEFTPQQVEAMIREVAPQIKAGRHWYAVYRPLVDLTFLSVNAYDAFVSMVRKEVPDHEHLPKRLELQRMAVGSFAKPVKFWREDNAPVQGTRFYKYKSIALHTFDLLGAEM